MAGSVSYRALQKGMVWDPLRVMVAHTGQASLPVRGGEAVGSALPPWLAQKPPGNRKASVSWSPGQPSWDPSTHVGAKNPSIGGFWGVTYYNCLFLRWGN